MQSATLKKALSHACAGALALAVATLGCSDVEARRPDLLLVTVDSLRADALHCYGGPENSGREMCALAESGALYLWALATAPSSAPAVASIHTSLYPHEHGVDARGPSFLRHRTRTLAEALEESGYRTAAVVSSPELGRARALHQGFQHFDEQRAKPARGLRERSAAETTDAALAWIARAPSPWFLWIHYRDPHVPYAAPEAPAPESALATSAAAFEASAPGADDTALGEPFRRYLGEVAYVDHQFGRLLSKLEAMGQRPEVILAGDHGESFGEGGVHFSHGHSLSLEQVRIPLLWRPVGPTAPLRIQTPVSALDIAPTLLAAASAAEPPSFRGEQLPSEDRFRDPAVPRTLFAEHPEQVAVLASGSYYRRDRGQGVSVVGGLLDEADLRRTHAATVELPRDHAAGLPPERPARPSGPARLLEPWLARFTGDDENAAPTPDPAGREAEVRDAELADGQEAQPASGPTGTRARSRRGSESASMPGDAAPRRPASTSDRQTPPAAPGR